jgi:hypothetical protein
VLLQEMEGIDALPFHKIPDSIFDVVVDFLMTKLPDDSTAHPQKATESILFKRPHEFLSHRTQERETVYAIRIDYILKVLSHRLGYELCGPIDGKSIAKGRPYITQEMNCRVFLIGLNVW